MKFWIILAIAFLSVACLAETVADVTPVVYEDPVEESYVEPTGTPDCLPSRGVMLEVQRINYRSVRLHASGLQPGEIPRIMYSASAMGFGVFGEEGDIARGADEHGNLSHDLGGLQLGQVSPDAPSSATWDIRLIHVRGVACETIRLP